MDTVCPGCHETFTRSGYGHHVVSTQRLRCRTVHDASRNRPGREMLPLTASSLAFNTIPGVDDSMPEDTNVVVLPPSSELAATRVLDDG